MVGGDIVSLLLFAAIGRGSHAETTGLAGALETALPFLIGAAIPQGLPGNDNYAVGFNPKWVGRYTCAVINWWMLVDIIASSTYLS